MKKYFFRIDADKRLAMFYYGEKKDTFVKTEIKFDDFFALAEDYQNNHHTSLKAVSEEMQKYVELGKKENAVFHAKLTRLKKKMADNIFALVFMNIMELFYQKQREKLIALNVKNLLQSVISFNTRQAKKAIQKKFEELEYNMIGFEFMLCGNLSIANKGAFFESNEGYIIFLEDNKSVIYCGLNESLEPFVEGFDAYLNASNTKIYICKNCGGRYFNTVDRGYCSKPVCQQFKRLMYKRQNRESRKQDVYRNLIDSYNTYVRTLKRKLTLMRVEKSDMQMFETEQEKCAAVIRETVSDYREQQKPIDNELNALILENRKKMKETTDKITEKYFG